MAYELFTSLTETEVKAIWNALDEGHQTVIHLQHNAVGAELALRTRQREEIHHALATLERKCSHMPYIQSVAVTLKESQAMPLPDRPST